MSKVASLTAGLVAKKGQASPAVIAEAVKSAQESSSSVADYYKALTVKLDRPRYEALKTAGMKQDKKSQEIFVEALDLWFAQAKAQSNAS